MKISKEAARDAYEYARAQMFYGEGAGTRRKLINASVDDKSMRIPGYAEAFDRALEMQDMVEHAQKARKERRHKDLTKKIDRNVRGLSTGNKQSLTTGVMLIASAAYVAHQTGYDKVILEQHLKPRYYKTKAWVLNQKDKLKKKTKAETGPNRFA